ncbi:MAG: hypothetical protein DI598_01195 [Pseudopedobacter saltans]|uniref:GLPGLI family protein n=1 Tax=Pseudopedobacter saltans TaxID=151895 RepID=A0A2W5FB97_9SPHI|nr:MAG: hypothetical protein DI598_01195 [Pseudopedobacter saltans]
MLKKFIVLSLAILPFISKAQIALFSNDKNEKLKDPEPSIGIVYYDFSYVSDTTKPENVSNQTMALSFGKDYSKFYSSTFKTEDSLIKADLTRQITEQNGLGNINLSARSSIKGTPDVFLIDLKSEKIFEVKRIGMKSYLVSGDNNTINWDIQDSTKKIGDYTCQKAVGLSKGRNYIVWFSTDLPYSYGPRRLFGLPGLILEAYDETNRIVYHFKSLEMTTSGQLGLPENGIPATAKEYKDLEKAFKADPSGFLKSSMQGSVSGASFGAPAGGNVQIKSITINKGDGPNGKKSSPKIINFPIDLTED